MYALYARQSIEKKDSISVESQLDFCKYETRGEPCREYADRGYSGKSLNRPAFEEMMGDIESGKISKVVVYKLDRISRSILDFSNLMETFQKYNVEFISTTEKFDTSTPIGRAMLNICIVFAQLERETIQKRVTDAYYSRSKKSFYMGGRVPYGFALEQTTIDGIKTSWYVPIPEESEHIKLLYSLYCDPSNSLCDVIKHLNEYGIENLRGGTWSTARISEMLRNPVYVKADADVYEFFQSQGANVVNPVSDFTGDNACYLYKGTISTTRKQCDLTDKDIVLAPHEGIVSSRDWIKCRIRCLNNRQSTRTCKPKNSWLTGKVKCGNCGYALVIRQAKTRWKRYFVCSAVSSTQKCKGAGTVYADVLEEYMLNAIKEKLAEFKALSIQQEAVISPKLNENKIRLLAIDREIDDMLSKVATANDILMGYINDKVTGLDAERRKLKEEIQTLSCQSDDANTLQITNHAETWENVSFEDRQAVVDALIKVIRIANGEIVIDWKI